MLPVPQRARYEELANALTHGLGLVAAIAGAPMLIIAAVRLGQTASIVGASIFAATMILMYLSSTLYHAFPHGNWKRIFHKLDHTAIYLLIAGTYTPFTLGIMRGQLGWTIFGAIWALASIGIVLKLFNRLSNPWLSVGLYLLMGWLVVFAAGPLMAKMPVNGLLWLAGGGVAYTLGVIFFALDARIRFGHAIWHLFVMAGTACHFFAVLYYANQGVIAG